MNLEINWIKEYVRIEDDIKNQYGVVRFHEIDLDQIERTGDLKTDYITAVENMLSNDLINMRDSETGEEIF